MDNVFMMQMNINGVRKDHRIVVDGLFDKQQTIDYIVKSMAEMITLQLLSGVYKQLNETLRFN
jgi:hypothetical protein